MERMAAWLWERYRQHFMLLLAVASSLFALVAILSPVVFIISAYLDTSLSENLIWGGAAAAVVVVGICGAIVASGETRRAISAWGAGKPVDPVVARDAAMRTTTSITIRGGVVICALELLIAVPILDRYADLSPAGLVATGIFICQILGASVLVIGLGFHALMRPMLRELDDQLPLGSDATARTWGMRSRLLLGVGAASAFAAMLGGVAVVAVDSRDGRILAAVLGSLLIAGYMVMLFNFGIVEPTVVPVVDLSRATLRVRQGNYDVRVPVTSADELGELAISFNDMQRGLREREALHAAFGSYVDPGLAQRLIESGSSLFQGEDLVVTVLFADVRDFTSYAEGVTPADAVEQLNRLFDVIVPVLHEHGGHANHYLGDGLLAVFGAPQPLARHADAAVEAAVEIQQRVRTEFGTELRLGIGINTGRVIAGTVGGGGRHEFTVIGDTVNVAARVEQLTKDTGDAILVTETTRAALSTPKPRTTRRGAFDLRGKSAAVTVYAVAVPRGR